MKLCSFITEGRECRLETTEEMNTDLSGLRDFSCQLGHKSDEIMNPTGQVSTRFRRSFRGGESWHFFPGCSQWPMKDYSSVQYLSGEVPICNECIAKTKMP